MLSKYGLEYRPSMENASGVRDFFDYIFLEYGNVIGKRLKSNEWVVNEVTSLKSEDVNVVNISNGIWKPEFYSVSVDVPKDFSDEHYEFALLLGSDDRFAEIMSNPSLIEGEDNTARGRVEFQVAVKSMINSEPAMHEREGYSTLSSKLKVPTLLSLHPSMITNLFPEKNHYSVTLVERGLEPLDAIDADRFVAESEGPSVFEKFMDTLGHLHANKFTHGDTQLRNFGYKKKQVYVMDPEAHIDFKKLPDLRRMSEYERGAYLQRFKLNERDYGSQLHLLKAIEEDILRATSSMSLPDTEETYRLAERVITKYVDKVSEANGFDDSFDEMVRSYFGLQSRD